MGPGPIKGKGKNPNPMANDGPWKKALLSQPVMRDESKADDDDERKKVYPKAERYVDKADETGKPIVALSEAACSLSRYRNDEGWQRIINAKRVFPEVKRRYVDPKEKPIVALSIAAFSRAAAEINPVDLSTFIEKLRASDCDVKLG